jgi:hypothetical protein
MAVFDYVCRKCGAVVGRARAYGRRAVATIPSCERASLKRCAAPFVVTGQR